MCPFLHSSHMHINATCAPSLCCRGGVPQPYGNLCAYVFILWLLLPSGPISAPGRQWTLSKHGDLGGYFLKSFIEMYNSHAIRFTHLKCIFNSIYDISRYVQTSPILVHFYHSPNKPPSPWAVTPPAPLPAPGSRWPASVSGCACAGRFV